MKKFNKNRIKKIKLQLKVTLNIQSSKMTTQTLQSGMVWKSTNDNQKMSTNSDNREMTIKNNIKLTTKNHIKCGLKKLFHSKFTWNRIPTYNDNQNDNLKRLLQKLIFIKNSVIFSQTKWTSLSFGKQNFQMINKSKRLIS